MNAPGVVAAASPLELLHPAGAVERVLVAGERCPTGLLPRAAERDQTDLSLAVIAPSAAELARPGWLTGTLTTAVTALADDGVLYALLPPAARLAVRRRLQMAGLELATPLAQLPAREPRYLVPLHGRPWRHMLRREIGAHPRLRRALAAAAAPPFGIRMLAEWLPGAAVVARRHGASPLGAWLERLAGDTRPVAHVAAMISWRGAAGPVVLFCFGDDDDRPWGVAKVGPGAQREAQRLERLGPEARAAGASVPQLLAVGMVSHQHALVESAIEGQPAARELTDAPQRFADVTRDIAGWLERWGAATARPTPLARDWLDRELLRGELPPSYRGWLADRCARLAGAAVPLVAAHHDLTMWNVRLGDRGTVGVLDWAEADTDALPLTDLFYAIADAAAACGGYRDRLAETRACFEPGGARVATAAPLVNRLTAALGLSPQVAELCFHACWLRHAANEREANAVQRPFAEILRWLAHRTGVA